MPVIFLEGVAEPDGTLRQVRAIKVGAGLTVTLHPDESLVGPNGAIRGYLEIAASGAIVPVSLTEPGDFPATSGFINLQTSSAGIYGRNTAHDADAPLLGWDGTTEQIGGPDAALPVLLLSGANVQITVNSKTRVGANGTSTVIVSPDGTSSTITASDGEITAYAAATGRVVLGCGSNDQIIVSQAKTTVMSPDNATSIEVKNSGAGTGITITGNLAFFGGTPGSKPTITGSKGGNVALGSLLSALATLGLVTDSTT